MCLMHVQTVFWEGVPGHRQRVHNTAQLKTPPLVALMCQAIALGPGVNPASLARHGLVQGPPPSYWARAPHNSWPSVSVSLPINPQDSARLLLDFYFEGVSVFMNCVSPTRSRGCVIIPCIVTTLPYPCSPAADTVFWGAGNILFRVRT